MNTKTSFKIFALVIIVLASVKRVKSEKNTTWIRDLKTQKLLESVAKLNSSLLSEMINKYKYIFLQLSRFEALNN